MCNFWHEIFFLKSLLMYLTVCNKLKFFSVLIYSKHFESLYNRKELKFIATKFTQEDVTFYSYTELFETKHRNILLEYHAETIFTGVCVLAL